MDLAQKKQRFANKLVETAQEADALYTRITGLLADFFAEGFNEGAENALEDADFGAPLEYLTAAKAQAAMNALQAVAATLEDGGNLTAIRQAKYE